MISYLITAFVLIVIFLIARDVIGNNKNKATLAQKQGPGVTKVSGTLTPPKSDKKKVADPVDIDMAKDGRKDKR